MCILVKNNKNKQIFIKDTTLATLVLIVIFFSAVFGIFSCIEIKSSVINIDKFSITISPGTPFSPTLMTHDPTSSEITLSWFIDSDIMTETTATVTLEDISIQAFYYKTNVKPKSAAELIRSGTAFGTPSNGKQPSIVLTNLNIATKYYAVLKLINTTDPIKVNYSNIVSFTTKSPLNMFTFSYVTLIGDIGVKSNSTPARWSSEIIGTNEVPVTYSITSRPARATPDGVTINTKTGVLTVTNTAVVRDIGIYTVTATVLEPNNYYDGTQTAIIQIILKHFESSNFIKLDSDGIQLDSQIEVYDVLGSSQESTKWECVLDNKTGLTWEIKTNDGGFRDRDNLYRWGGISAMGRNDAKKEGPYYNDWDSLIQAANTENTKGLCGFNDWRIPLKEELQSINDIKLYDPTLNTHFFPNTIAAKYWTASPSIQRFSVDGSYLYNAWWVEFDFGFISYTTRSIENHVRLVRGGALTIKEIESNYKRGFWPNDRYEVHGDGTVTDNITGLMWKQCSEGLSNEDCTGTPTRFKYVETLSLNNTSYAGYSDWRVPTAIELNTLAAINRYSPAINSTVFPNTPYDLENTINSMFWTASISVFYPSQIGWTLNFYNGTLTGYGNFSYLRFPHFVRLVRGQQRE